MESRLTESLDILQLRDQVIAGAQLLENSLQDALANEAELREQAEQSAVLAEVDRREIRENKPEKIGKKLDDLIPKTSPLLEKLLRYLGAQDKDLQDFECLLGMNFISDPIKVKHTRENKISSKEEVNETLSIKQFKEAGWEYYEKATLEYDLKNRNEAHPVTLAKIKKEDLIEAPEFEKEKLALIKSFLKKGLIDLGADENIIKEYCDERINLLEKLATIEEIQRIIELFKTLYEKKLSELLSDKEKNKFHCVFSQRVIFDPVKLKDPNGNWIYFEKEVLEKNLRENKLNPLTGNPFSKDEKPRDAPEYIDHLRETISLAAESINDNLTSAPLEGISEAPAESVNREAARLREAATTEREKKLELHRLEQETKKAEEETRLKLLQEDKEKQRLWVIQHRSQLRNQPYAKIIEPLLQALEKLTQDPKKYSKERKVFRDSLESFAKKLNDSLMEEEPIIGAPGKNIQQARYAKSEELVSLTTKMLEDIQKEKGYETQKGYLDRKLIMLINYENACKEIIGANQKLLKALTVVCFAAVGFLVGLTIGITIGALVGSLTGPGAIITAAFGAISGALKGGAMGAASGAAAFGVLGATAVGLGLFKPKLYETEIHQVRQAGQEFIKSMLEKK